MRGVIFASFNLTGENHEKTPLLLCLNLALANTFAETNIAGTPVTQQNVAQVMEIQRVADTMSNAVDAKDWDLVRLLMTDDVETSLGSDKTEITTADKLINQKTL